MRVVPLSSVCEVLMGTAPPSSSYNDSGHGVLLIAGAGDYGETYPQPSKWTTAPTRVTREGDLILCVRATIGDLNWANQEYCLGRGVAGLRVHQRDLDSKYLAFYLQYAKKDLARLGTGSTFLAIRRDNIESFEIPLPPLHQQKRIADILDKADAIRRKRKYVQKKVDQLLAPVFFEQFGDPVLNSQGRETITLSQYGNITTGNTPSRKDPNNYGDAIEWIKSDNINTPSHWLTHASEGLSYQGLSQARTVDVGATLVTCIAGSPECVGNAAITNRKVAFNQQINAITPANGVDPFFLYVLILLSKPLIQSASTQSMKGMVSKSKFEQVKVIFAPHAEQLTFNRIIQKIFNMTNKQRGLAFQVDDLFNSLVQRAFKGEL